MLCCLTQKYNKADISGTNSIATKRNLALDRLFLAFPCRKLEQTEAIKKENLLYCAYCIQIHNNNKADKLKFIYGVNCMVIKQSGLILLVIRSC